MILGPYDPRGIRTWKITFVGEDGETATVSKMTSGSEILSVLDWLRDQGATVTDVKPFHPMLLDKE